MSEQDQVKPYHAKDAAATGQEAADAVADVLKHAAERDEAAHRKTKPKTQPKWMLPVAINIGVLAVYLQVAPPQWVELNPIQPPPAVEQVAALRNAMYIGGIARIETFLASNGRLPATLEEAGATSLVGAVDYVVSGDSTYVLIGNVGEEVVSYDSATMSVAEFTGPINLPG